MKIHDGKNWSDKTLKSKIQYCVNRPKPIKQCYTEDTQKRIVALSRVGIYIIHEPCDMALKIHKALYEI